MNNKESFLSSKTYSIGRAWEQAAKSIFLKNGFLVKDVSLEEGNRDLIVSNKKFSIDFECKKFNHKEFDVHKISVNQYLRYQRKYDRHKIYLYWNAGDIGHEVFTLDKISELITNFKKPQHWVNDGKELYFYHFPRDTGMPLEIFMEIFSVSRAKSELEGEMNYFLRVGERHGG